MCAQIVPLWLQKESPIIPFDKYMALALYHPTHGYYQQPKTPVGRDFETACTLSPHLGEMLAISIHSCFTPPYNLYEIGPGNGDLMVAVLKKLSSLDCLPTRVYLHDIAPMRIQQSKTKISSQLPHISIEIMHEKPSQWQGALIANEVLDAMPFKRFYHDGSQLFEMHVNTKTLQWHQQESSQTSPQQGPYFYEKSDYDAICPWLKSCKNGMLWLIDYGYSQSEYYHPERINGSMTCFKEGRKHNNPLHEPGQHDITAHVNWSKVAQLVQNHGLSVYGYTSQAMFMQACMRSKMIDPCTDLNTLKTLMYPGEMGETIKVMMCGSPNQPPPLGSASKHLLEQYTN